MNLLKQVLKNLLTCRVITELDDILIQASQIHEHQWGRKATGCTGDAVSSAIV